MNALTEVLKAWRSTREGTLRALPELGDADPEELVHAVERAASGVVESALVPVAQPGTGVISQPRALLALLAFWYARQVYGSAEIVAKLNHDHARFRFGSEPLPDTHTLRRFRAHNREALHTCLTSVLRFLAQEKVTQGIITHVSETHLAEEANRRLIMALFTDSLELDKECSSQEQPEACFIVANK